jgi:O-antigen/teichoic acid export membrane protein
MPSPTGRFAGPALLLVGTRILNMGMGLVMVPVLIHALGSRGFGAWAILLGCAAVFGELEIGMPAALVRGLALPLRTPPSREACQVFTAATVTVGAAYLCALPFVLFGARGLGGWLRLPETRLFAASQLVTFVFMCCGLRAVLQLGAYALVGARAFNLVAAFALLQPLSSNLGAIVAAVLWRRVDVALLWYWALQVVVVGVGFVAATLRIGWWRGENRGFPGRKQWAALVRYGLVVQASDWAHTLTFHLNKGLIVRSLGLAGVSGYEVASRAALALRSVPAAGVETFLPAATIAAAEGPQSSESLNTMLKLTVYGTLLFLLAPAAVAPVLLYGWVGELGFVSRWVFVGLVVASSASLLSMPFATMAQALGRPIIQARAAFVTVTLSLTFGAALVPGLGAEGVALATAVSAVVGAALMVAEVLGVLRLPFRDTVWRAVVGRWPAALACLLFGSALAWAFRVWLESTPLSARYTVTARAEGLLMCAVLYVACVVAMVVAQGWIRGFDVDERAMFGLLRARARWGEREAPNAR